MEVHGRPALGPWLPRLPACGCHTPAVSPPRPPPLPSRAPGKHPLSKVTAQGQPGAGVLVKASDRQGCRLWTDRWTEAQADSGAPSLVGGVGSRPTPARLFLWLAGTRHCPSPHSESLAVRECLVLRAEQWLRLLIPGVVGAGEGPATRGEAWRGWGGHDTRLQPHDQGVVGERRGTCGRGPVLPHTVGEWRPAVAVSLRVH